MHLDRYPQELEILADGIDDGFLGIGEICIGEIESQKCLATVCAKSACEIVYSYIEKIADH